MCTRICEFLEVLIGLLLCQNDPSDIRAKYAWIWWYSCKILDTNVLFAPGICIIMGHMILGSAKITTNTKNNQKSKISQNGKLPTLRTVTAWTPINSLKMTLRQRIKIILIQYSMFLLFNFLLEICIFLNFLFSEGEKKGLKHDFEIFLPRSTQDPLNVPPFMKGRRTPLWLLLPLIKGGTLWLEWKYFHQRHLKVSKRLIIPNGWHTVGKNSCCN